MPCSVPLGHWSGLKSGCCTEHPVKRGCAECGTQELGGCIAKANPSDTCLCPFHRSMGGRVGGWVGFPDDAEDSCTGWRRCVWACLGMGGRRCVGAYLCEAYCEAYIGG